MAYPNEQPAGPSQPFEGPAPATRPQWLRLAGRPRPWRRTLAAGGGVALVIMLLGGLLGLLWSRVAPGVPVVKLADGSIVVSDLSPEQYIAADGWFTLLGLGFGLIVTVGSWLVLRHYRGPFLLLGIVTGTLVAGRWVAPAVGEFPGHDAYQRWREVAAEGATYLAPPAVQALGPKLMPAFIAAVVLTLLAGWSNDPDLDQPGAHPGYGPNHAHPASGPGDDDHVPSGSSLPAGEVVAREQPEAAPSRPGGAAMAQDRPGGGPAEPVGGAGHQPEPHHPV